MCYKGPKPKVSMLQIFSSRPPPLGRIPDAVATHSAAGAWACPGVCVAGRWRARSWRSGDPNKEDFELNTASSN